MLDSLADLQAAQARNASSTAAPTTHAAVGTSSSERATAPTTQGPLGIGSGARPRSKFPVQIDTFTPATVGSPVLPAHFEEIASATRGAQEALFRLVRTAPGDPADLLTGRSDVRDSNGVLVGSTGGIRLLGGGASSALSPPVLVSLGSPVTVGASSVLARVDLALTTGQKTALGISGGWSTGPGIAWLTGARLMSYSGTWDPASLAARVSARIDEAGTLRLFLRPNTFDATAFPIAGTPVLAPGLWYVWILFVSSAYAW